MYEFFLILLPLIGLSLVGGIHMVEIVSFVSPAGYHVLHVKLSMYYV